MCFNPSPERRVPSPNRYMAFARFCFCKNNKRTIIIDKLLKRQAFEDVSKKIKSCALNLKKARISAYSLQDQWVVGRHGSVGTREQADKNGSSKLQFSAATHLIRSKVSIRENFAPKLPKICPNQPSVGSHPAHYRKCKTQCKAIMEDVNKLDNIQDGFIHYQLILFCQSTRLQYLNGHIRPHTRTKTCSSSTLTTRSPTPS